MDLDTFEDIPGSMISNWAYMFLLLEMGMYFLGLFI